MRLLGMAAGLVAAVIPASAGTFIQKGVLVDNIYPKNDAFSNTVHAAGYKYLLKNATPMYPLLPPWMSAYPTVATTGQNNPGGSNRIRWKNSDATFLDATPMVGWQGGSGTCSVTFPNNLADAARVNMAVIMATGSGQMGGTGGYSNTLNLTTIKMGSAAAVAPTTVNMCPTQIGGFNAGDERAVVQRFELNMDAGETIIVSFTDAGYNTGGFYLAFSDTLQGPPDVPTLAATAPAGIDNKIDLSWTADPKATGYTIQRKLGLGGTYSTIATLLEGAGSYSDTLVRAQARYFYKIMASGPDGSSVYSTEVDVIPNGTYVDPTVVWNETLLYNDNIGNQDTTLDAGLKSNGYNVLLRNAATSVSPSQPAWWYTMPAFALVSGTNNTNGTAYGPLWNWAGGNPTGALCGNVNALSTATVTFTANVTTRTTKQMAVALTTGSGSAAGTASATVKTIQIGDTVFTLDKVLTVSSDPATYPMGKATVGELTMEFSQGDVIKVTLEYGAGATGHGVSLAFKDSTLPAVPAAPSNLTATAISTTQINLGWFNNDTNATGYQVLRFAGALTATTRLASQAAVNAGVNTYNNTGLTNGTTYSYLIVAKGAGGNSYSGLANSGVAAAVAGPLQNGSSVAQAQLYNNNIASRTTALYDAMQAKSYTVLLAKDAVPYPNPVSWWGGIAPIITPVSGAANDPQASTGILWNSVECTPLAGEASAPTSGGVAKITLQSEISTAVLDTRMAMILSCPTGATTVNAKLLSIKVGTKTTTLNQALTASGDNASVSETLMRLMPGVSIEITISYGSAASLSGVSLAFQDVGIPAAPTSVIATSVSETET